MHSHAKMQTADREERALFAGEFRLLQPDKFINDLSLNRLQY